MERHLQRSVSRREELNCSNIYTIFVSEGVVAVTITTVTSRELNQDVTSAKRATKNGPVFITDRGRPAHVLLSFEEYQRLTHQRRNIADALSMPGAAEIEFDPLRASLRHRPADLL